MARNKATSRIPSWFNLAAYDDLSGMDASGWLKVLEDLLILLGYEQADFVDEDSGETLAMDILEDAFVQFQAGSSRHGFGRRMQKYVVDPSVYDFGTTRSLSIWTVARMGATLEHLEDGRKFMGAMRRLVNQEQKGGYAALQRAHSRLRAFEEFSDKPFFVALRDSSLRNDSGNALTTNRAISVDMSAPDDILLADFKNWLVEMRKLEHHRAARRSFTRADFQKWSRNAYVPLLVLDKWKRLTGSRLTQGDICDAAFPSGQRVEVDDLRKTLLPNALAWASTETVEALAAQASRDPILDRPEEI